TVGLWKELFDPTFEAFQKWGLELIVLNNAHSHPSGRIESDGYTPLIDDAVLWFQHGVFPAGKLCGANVRHVETSRRRRGWAEKLLKVLLRSARLQGLADILLRQMFWVRSEWCNKCNDNERAYHQQPEPPPFQQRSHSRILLAIDFGQQLFHRPRMPGDLGFIAAAV